MFKNNKNKEKKDDKKKFNFSKHKLNFIIISYANYKNANSKY